MTHRIFLIDIIWARPLASLLDLVGIPVSSFNPTSIERHLPAKEPSETMSRCPSRLLEFVYPRVGGSDLVEREVAHLSVGEGPTQCPHPSVPMPGSTELHVKRSRGFRPLDDFLSNNGKPLDLVEMFGIPFDVCPTCLRIPAVKIVHDYQNADLPIFEDQLFGFWNKSFVVFATEPSVQINLQNPAVNLFVNVCGGIHIGNPP